MNNLIKLAAGVLGGIAVVFTLGGFSVSSSSDDESSEGKNDSCDNDSPFVTDDSNDIPDSILDGVDGDYYKQRQQRDRERQSANRSKENIRSFQEGLVKVSNMLGHLCTIVDSLQRMFTRQQPRLEMNPTTYIY